MSCVPLPKFSAGERASADIFNRPLVVCDSNNEFLEEQIGAAISSLQEIEESLASGMGDMLRANYAINSASIVDRSFAVRCEQEEYDLPGDDILSHINDSGAHGGGGSVIFSIITTTQLYYPLTMSGGDGIYHLDSFPGYDFRLNISTDGGATWTVLADTNGLTIGLKDGWKIRDTGGYYPQIKIIKFFAL